ncbi:SNF2 family N-terminal domain-containing protein [Cladorrhinum samala]|uniref:SNF2 family N-terminal domain-containing protein n=1 Tax=Cladorrhinum samala TaxID=585594 RepID=A0AAV9HZN4_9PEZI|nr:SNF2 family N-terminal domain-containing protein [Cladorrhinum samala]
MASLPTPTPIHGTLRPPKRRHAYDSRPQASPKRPRPSPDCSDLDCSTPGSDAPYITSDRGSPVPRSPAREGSFPSLNDDLEEEDDSTGGLGEEIEVMDWERNDEAEREICYGAICEAQALFPRKMDASKLCSTWKRFRHLNLIVVGWGFALSTRKESESSSPVAQLNSTTCRAITKLRHLSGVTFEAIVDRFQISSGRNAPSGKGFIMQLSVNVYGPFTTADQVGSVLSSASTFLQNPYSLASKYRYYNPQMYRIGGIMEDLTHLVGMSEKDFQAKAISDEVEQVLGTIDSTIFQDDNNAMDYRMTIEPLREAQPVNLTVELKEHQKRALTFIRRREDFQDCDRTRHSLAHLLQLPDEIMIPSFATGGILADIMGLGKTLTMISAILETLDEAATHEGQNDIDTNYCRSKATLIVVSSIQVLHVWESEIQSRTKPGSLKSYRFHGATRASSLEGMSGYDIVLTTYGVLCADFKSGRLLQNIEWFRIVLDEAHWIRNPNSKQFEAAESLNSARRWCLTGTPIQNRLDDLLSLLRFIQFEPFCRRTVFHQYILEPLKHEGENRSLRLKSLLGAICLRRGEKLLNLPQPQFEQLSVTLGEQERKLYNEILRECARDMDENISSRESIKKFGLLFAAIMKLRRLCNHGVLAPHFNPSGRDITAQDVQNGDAEVEETGCDLCTGTGEDRIDVADGEICTGCGKTAALSIPTDANKSAKGKSKASPQLPSIQTTLCSGRERGISTKVGAVVQKLKEMDFGTKSLVFSYWTTTLDLLEGHMKHAGISCLRIDGRVSHEQRLRILNDFKTTQVQVLLMTIQTGAVGLNLTAANYVHIVEPQWNPSVEEQAIARAVRMGQTRTVTVIRYVVKDSVEENIVALQKRKRSLAKFTLDGSSDEGTSGSLDDLNFVLNFGSA